MAKNQPGVLARQDKIKKARKEYMNSPEAAEKFKDVLSYTPAFPLVTGKNMYDAYKKGDTADMVAEGLAGTAVGIGSMFLPPMVIGGLKKGYKGLKNLFKGPLSPQYNYKGTMKKYKRGK